MKQCVCVHACVCGGGAIRGVKLGCSESLAIPSMLTQMLSSHNYRVYLKMVITLDGPASLPIIAKPLEVDDQDRRKCLDASSLQCVSLSTNRCV